jgi:cubilin
LRRKCRTKIVRINYIKSQISYRSPGCNENYLEVRKNDANGELVGVFCSNKLPENISPCRGFWIKYKTDLTTANPGFLAEYKYLDSSDLTGSSGLIESPNYPNIFRLEFNSNYRITVQQGSVIRFEIIDLYMDEDDPDDCITSLKFYNGYDDTASVLTELCKFTSEPIYSEANVVFIVFFNNYKGKTKFQLKWDQVDKNITTDRTDSTCKSEIISLNNITQEVNITSPGYPNGYGINLKCEWIIESGIASYRPVVSFIDVDLEEQTDNSIENSCLADYVKVSTSLEDGTWKELGKVCSFDIRNRRVFLGTPSLKVEFKSDYYTNKTGFSSKTFLECGGMYKDPDGIIEYDDVYSKYHRFDQDCMWNITVRRGKKIQFEFLEMNMKNDSNICNNHIMIKNGQNNESPYLGDGQFCSIPDTPIPLTSSNRAFVRFVIRDHFMNSFKLRYYEVSHECGGQIRLSSAFKSTNISSPNYPNIPPPHIECKWTIIAPVGEQLRIDFLERFDLEYSPTCSKEFVEIRDGSTSFSPLIGSYCTEKPGTLYSKSNVLRILYFTDSPDPHNGFRANISIGVCGGTINALQYGYLMSPKYPGLGAYPSNITCDYRVIGSFSHVFNIDIVDIDLPSSQITDDKGNVVCNKSADYLQILTIFQDNNSTDGESLFEIGTYCGTNPLISSITTDSNEFIVRLKTFPKTKETYKGFKIFYNATRLDCGGEFNQDSGVITSIGYPVKTQKMGLCDWRITVRKGKRVKVEFEDLDLADAKSLLAQRIGFYNDFRYHSRIKFVVNSTQTDPIYSTDNQLMIVFVTRFASLNRGFKLKFSSEENANCEGSLNNNEGYIYSPIVASGFTCTYNREVGYLIENKKDVGTMAFYFEKTNFVNPGMSRCRYTPMGITLTRVSAEHDSLKLLGRICNNQTEKMIILSTFPDLKLLLMQGTYFAPMNMSLQYKIHNCGGVLKGSGSKIIKNPSPDTANYQILDCGWFIKYEEEASISLTVNKLILKLPCEQEYIIIYNGPTQMSPKVAKLCGNEFNHIPTIASNIIFIEYHSEKFNSDSRNSIFELQTDMTTFGCGGILNHNDFMFTSPFYGQSKSYPPNTECIWELRANEGYHVGLTFVGRYFIEDSPNCTKDYVEFYDWINNDWSLMQRVCGRAVPKPVNATSTRMKVIFRSDATTNGDGFNATWNENCGGIFEVTDRRKILSSPNYPQIYSPNLYCNYTFKAAIDESFVNIRFLDFELEKIDSKCVFDNLTLYRYYDHLPDTDYFSGIYCGNKNPGHFRYKDKIKLSFKTDRWVERKGFQVEYYLDSCGGEITAPSSISSPPVVRRLEYEWLGSLICQWNITAKPNEAIVIKFDKVSFEASDYCSLDHIEIYNGTNATTENLLVQLCSNLTEPVKPIIISNHKAIIKVKLDQTNPEAGFKGSISMQKVCDEKIVLNKDKTSYILDKTKVLLQNNLVCSFVFIGDPLSVLKVTILEIHLSICDPDVNKNPCECDYLEFLDGRGPFSPAIGTRKCGHNVSDSAFTTTGSALYIHLSTDGIRQSTGFKLQVDMETSPCGSMPYINITKENHTFTLSSPKAPNSLKYPSNIRCLWIVESDYKESIEIIFNKFQLEDSKNCSNDFLKIEDDNVKNYVTEGLGESLVFHGEKSAVRTPYFFNGVNGPSAPHIYCNNILPHDYLSSSNKIRIYFESNSMAEFEGFELKIKTVDACSRNFTALQGRLVSSPDPKDCQITIKVPENYTISLYFYRFNFYQTNCDKASMKIYDGDLATGALMGRVCGYTLPDPFFSTGNQISINIAYGDDETYMYMRGNYDILYTASKKEDGRGCGGEIFNYGGIFSSPLYPNSNRTNNDCTWTVTVPQNLKIAIKFSGNSREF